MLEIKCFPAIPGELALNPANVNTCLFEGLYRESVTVGEQTRTFYTYLTPGLRYVRPCVFVLPENTQLFLESFEHSFWKDFADREEVFLFIPEPQNGAWNPDGSDADYLNRVYMQVQSRNFYVTIQDTMYAVGIGSGAVIAQQAAMKMTSEWAGLATFGELTEAAMNNAQAVHRSEDTGRVEMAISGSKAPLPVWMAWRENTDANAAVCNYWKEQNFVNPQRFSNADADEIYFPTTVVRKSQLNDALMSEVRVTNGFAGEMTAAQWEPVWNFLKEAFRYRSYGQGKMLRRRKDVKAYGLTLHTMDHDGYTRLWYEYVPDSVKNANTPVPLVTAQHARGSSAEFYVSLSDMTTIAEERGFIVVFPESACYQQKPGGIRNIPLWNGNLDGKDFDDVGFILKVIADVKSRYAIDPTRVYACGQSSGGMMTNVLAQAAPGEFAAVACSSALVDPEKPVLHPAPIVPAIPYLFLFGEKDWLVAGKDGGELDIGCNHDIAEFLTTIMQMYKLDTKPMVYSCGEITFYLYCNAQKVPMLTVGRVKGMSHAIYPRECWLMYDEFLSKFTRTEDGILYYMGQRVEN